MTDAVGLWATPEDEGLYITITMAIRSKQERHGKPEPKSILTSPARIGEPPPLV
jgi:hypothetical protein